MWELITKIDLTVVLWNIIPEEIRIIVSIFCFFYSGLDIVQLCTL